MGHRAGVDPRFIGCPSHSIIMKTCWRIVCLIIRAVEFRTEDKKSEQAQPVISTEPVRTLVDCERFIVILESYALIASQNIPCSLGVGTFLSYLKSL